MFFLDNPNDLLVLKWLLSSRCGSSFNSRDGHTCGSCSNLARPLCLELRSLAVKLCFHHDSWSSIRGLFLRVYFLHVFPIYCLGYHKASEVYCKLYFSQESIIAFGVRSDAPTGKRNSGNSCKSQRVSELQARMQCETSGYCSTPSGAYTCTCSLVHVNLQL